MECFVNEEEIFHDNFTYREFFYRLIEFKNSLVIVFYTFLYIIILIWKNWNSCLIGVIITHYMMLI